MTEGINLRRRSDDWTTRGLLLALLVLDAALVVAALHWPTVWVAVAFSAVITLALAYQVGRPFEMTFEVTEADAAWTRFRGKRVVVSRIDVKSVSIYGGNELDYSRVDKIDRTRIRLPDEIFIGLAVDPISLGRDWQRLWPEKAFFVHNLPLDSQE